MILFENFNTTNQTSPHAEKHIDFISDMQLPTCAIVASLEYADRCAFVKESEECRENVFIIDYTNLLYCVIDPRSVFVTIMAVILLLMILTLLFLILGATADAFFCPSLTVLSHMMGLNENVAGVTLLAFGNGAPDIFTSYANLARATNTQFSNVYGSTMFVILLVAGFIVIYSPFSVLPATFLRDILFFLVSLCYIDYCIKYSYSVTFNQSIALGSIYICYIFIVVLDQYLLKRATRSLERMKRERKFGKRMSSIDTSNLKHLEKEGVLTAHSKSTIFIKRDYEAVVLSSDIGIFSQFVHTIIPFSREEFRDSGWFFCFFLCLQYPILLILRFMIPLVEIDETNQGWSRLLNCMQICMLPTFISYGFVNMMKFYGIPIVAIVGLVSASIGAILFFITDTNEAPKFHMYLSIFGVIGSIYVVYSVAEEIVSILEVIGIMTQLSNSFIGCTLLAMGNSLGDLVTDISLARAGYHKMAFAACFGGPLCTSLMSLSPILMFQTAQEEEYYINFPEGTMGENVVTFLYIGLIGTVIASCTTDFAFRRSIGIFMLSVYILFLIFSVLGEFEIIHTLGSDHSLDIKIDKSL